MDATPQRAPRPLGLLAELTHRCPLGCPYCSNPLALEAPRRRARHRDLGARVQAKPRRSACCRCISPAASRARGAISSRSRTAAHDAGLYTNLITSAVGITKETLGKLVRCRARPRADLDPGQRARHRPTTSPATRAPTRASTRSPREVTRLGIPLTVNAVMHRANIDHVEDMVELALTLGAKRVEIAHVQYYGWALKNRAQLMPTREQVERAVQAVERLRERHHGADRHRRRGAGLLRALPEALRRRLGPALAQRHAVRQGAALPRRREHSGPRILERARAFARRHLGQFAGVQGVPRHRLDAGALPLLPEAREDFGGCRCQAFALTGDARATDPGVPSLAAACAGRRAGGGARGRRVRLPALIILPA